MSDAEEPPTKMSKYEVEEYLEEAEEEILEEGQEEWLSEGVLTDEDYQIPEHDKTDIDLKPKQEDQDTTQDLHDDSMTEASQDMEQKPAIVTQNIEETLNSLDSTKNGIADDLDAFLIRKADGKIVETKIKEDKNKEDDGNDTDDLLRMLGEGDQNVKKKSMKMMKQEKNDELGSSDDDEFIYERSKVKTLKLAKNALIKRTPAMKAEPEDMSEGDDESDQSSDEGSTVKRMFEIQKNVIQTKPVTKKIVKHVVQVNTSVNKHDKPQLKITSKPTTITSQKSTSSSSQKPTLNTSQKSTSITSQRPTSNTSQRPTATSSQKPTSKPAPQSNLLTKAPFKSVEIKTPAPFKPLSKSTFKDSLKLERKDFKHEEFDEIIDEEEFLEEDDIDLDEEEFAEESEGDNSKKQRIMKPEMMDEEVPSDGESHSEDGSLYDELPSSDSDDMDDWFTLDIRAERASDYLPLLGSKARALLLGERARVSGRVATLRHSLSALTDSARRQADTLRHAAMALAELDDTLRAY